MEFSFDISDFRTIPGVERLNVLHRDALVREMRTFLREVARGADVRVDGTLVTVTHAEPSNHEILN